MSNEIMQENIPFVECSAFHRGMSVLEASLRNTEDSEAIISGLLKGAAEFYGASRASVVEADWDLGIGVITYEWCKDGVPAQRDMLQCLPMEKFPRWRKALRANKPVVISDLQRLEKVYPDEAAFFREYGVTTLLAAPFSKRINQGFIAVDDPTRYTDDPVFLFIASYAVVVELNEIKQQQSLLAATKASKYNPEDIHINFFGGMEIISSKGTLTGEDIKADQCYLLLAYLILNHKKNFTVDTLAEIICPYDELDSPYKVVNNIVYRLRRTLSVIGLDKLVIGKNGTFQINPNFNIHTDFDRFEDACIQLKTEENPDMRHSLYHSAVDMYKGQLLPRCEHELWLMQLSMYYQSLYLQITKGYVRLKMECKDYILAQKTAIDALRFDPKDSELNMYAILAMGFQGNLSMAQTYYTAAKPYASKYALSERLVCGECGTLYRRCTWTRNGEKRVVWRCVSRLDYGKKYCHNSPTLDEAPLQQAILAVLNTAMADKNSLIRQITAAMETELIPFPGGTMSLGDIECRLRVLEQQFQTLLEKATDDPTAYGGQFKEILDEQTFLKEKRSVILANNNEQAKANQRIMDAAQTLENASPYITEWDESAVRQLVETVKILSKDEIAVTLKGGIEICQKIMY